MRLSSAIRTEIFFDKRTERRTQKILLVHERNNVDLNDLTQLVPLENSASRFPTFLLLDRCKSDRLEGQELCTYCCYLCIGHSAKAVSMRNKRQPVKMGVLTLEDEGVASGGDYLPAASSQTALDAPPGLGDHLPNTPRLALPTRSPLTVEISLTADSNQRALEHTSISSNNTSPELEGSKNRFSLILNFKQLRRISVHSDVVEEELVCVILVDIMNCILCIDN